LARCHRGVHTLSARYPRGHERVYTLERDPYKRTGSLNDNAGRAPSRSHQARYRVSRFTMNILSNYKVDKKWRDGSPTRFRNHQRLVRGCRPRFDFSPAPIGTVALQGLPWHRDSNSDLQGKRLRRLQNGGVGARRGNVSVVVLGARGSADSLTLFVGILYSETGAFQRLGSSESRDPSRGVPLAGLGRSIAPLGT